MSNLYLNTGNGLVPVGGGSYMNVTPWTALPLNGTWANYGAGATPAEYRLFGDKVELRGLVKHVAAIGADLTIGTLPPNFRPYSGLPIGVGMGYAAGIGYFSARITANTTGALLLEPNDAFTSLTGSIDYISLESLSFSITPSNQIPKYEQVPSSEVSCQTTEKAPTAVAATWTKSLLTDFISNVGGFTITSNNLYVPVTGLYLIDIRWVTGNPMVLADEGYGSSSSWFIDTNTTTIVAGHASKIRRLTPTDAFQLWFYNRGATGTITTQLTLAKF